MYGHGMEEFWDQVHTTERVDGKGLTGNHLPGYLDVFKIHSIYNEAKTVLEIGVGLGYVVQEMHRDGKEVYGVDISLIGLQYLLPYLKDYWLPHEYSRIPADFFDLVFSKTVSLHLVDEELEDQIKHVLRILKSSGVFALEFYDRPLYSGTACQRAGTVYRTFDFVKGLIEKYGGNISFYTEQKYPGVSPPILGWCLWVKRKE